MATEDRRAAGRSSPPHLEMVGRPGARELAPRSQPPRQTSRAGASEGPRSLKLDDAARLCSGVSGAPGQRQENLLLNPAPVPRRSLGLAFLDFSSPHTMPSQFYSTCAAILRMACACFEGAPELSTCLRAPRLRPTRARARTQSRGTARAANSQRPAHRTGSARPICAFGASIFVVDSVTPEVFWITRADFFLSLFDKFCEQPNMRSHGTCTISPGMVWHGPREASRLPVLRHLGSLQHI